MIEKYQSVSGKLHDARFYGFLLDFNPETFKLNVLLYIHIFSDFDSEKYCLEKALVIFENASIQKLKIINDLNSGQFFIVDVIASDLGGGKHKFNMIFDDSSIELELIADNMIIAPSGAIEEKNTQLLATNWKNLFN